MTREMQDPAKNQYGDDTHPAFALIGASRVQCGPPGAVLFDSDVRHQNVVRIRVMAATRKREINRDWVYGDINKTYVEVELSEAQWASFVSTMNVGDGVPCTVRATADDCQVPELPYDPRLAHSMRENREAAHRAFDEIKSAMDAYAKTLADKAPAKERNEALNCLQAVIRNAVPNVDYAGKTLSKHAENVVQRARADIEAFVVGKARQLGLDPAQVGDHLQIEAGNADG